MLAFGCDRPIIQSAMGDNKAMKFLAIECSSDTLSLAASKNLNTWSFECTAGARTSSVLIPECLNGMAELDLNFKQLDAIVYGKGPGSFTGLRTACSAAQGFSFGHGVPTLGFDSLLVLAQSALQARPQFSHVLSILDARMGQIYVGAYEKIHPRWLVNLAPCLLDPSAMQLPKVWTEAHSNLSVLVACNALNIFQDDIEQMLCTQSVKYELIQISPRADALIELAKAHCADTGFSLELQTCTSLPTPLYLRDRVAQTTLERSQARESNLAHRP